MISKLSPEDAKLVTLARSARARRDTPEGAAVRDLDGRTYVASSVTLASLQLTALETAVAMAVSAGAQGLEAAAVVTTAEPAAVRREAVLDFAGPGIPVIGADWDGAVRGVVST